MEKVRIGFVGVGSMGQSAHLKNYAVLAKCEVAAIAELRPNLRQAVAARYGVAKTYASADEMLAAEALDGIVASQPFARHGVLVPELLKAGVPVLTEKPIASTVAAGERIVAAEAAGDGFLMIGYNKRSDPATECAKAEIDRLKAGGELGPLRYVRITMPPGDWIAGGFDDQIRVDSERQQLETDPPDAAMDEATFKKYTSFVNYYIHQVNLLRHLLGEGYRVTHADPSGVLLVAESDSGVCGTIEMAPYNTTVDWQENALTCFDKGYVKLLLPAPVAQARPGTVEILRDPGGGATPETVRPQLPWTSSMRNQAANFLRAIRGEIAPPCGASEALEDLKVARQYIDLLGA